jgi:malate synthase
MTFVELRARVFENLNAYPPEQQITIRSIETAVDKLKAEYDDELQGNADEAAIDHKFRLKLGYVILNCVGERGFKTLLEESHASIQPLVSTSPPPQN